MLAILLETFWLLALAVVAIFGFFFLLGAFSPGQEATLTVIVVALAVLWIVHAVWQTRHADGRDPRARRARERRGF